MTKWIIICLTTLLLAGASVLVVCGVFSIGFCKPDLSHHRQIDLQLVQQADSGEVVHYEQKYGEVFVSLVDRVGDCHIFLLTHPGKSVPETLEILNRTQEEQQNRKLNQASEATSLRTEPQR
ncbi:MAG: hypothetical protein NTY19_23930 [Planctomycetota bacterium]|nr:hypothetical protein [Planctomycetota bacterium]